MEDVANPTASLDGRPLDVKSGFAKTGVYTIPVQAGSYIKSDPTFPPALTRTRVASAGWIVRIHPLRPGTHDLALADELFDGTNWTPFTATFHITVQPHRG
jgi:hypothetical protein